MFLLQVMADQVRTICLHCSHAAAMEEELELGLEVCTQCHGPIAAPGICVRSSGQAALSRALFNRLRVARQLSPVRSFVANITKEQFKRWRTATWQHLSSIRTAKMDEDAFLVVEWSDVKALCTFELVSRGTADPSQGRGNLRFTARGGMGVIVPPMKLVHR